MIVSLLLLPMTGFSQVLAKDIPPNHSLIFQVLQDEFIFDNTTVKNATIIENDGVYSGLNIQLKPEAAAVLTDITKAGLGRRLNLVFNKVVVTTTLIQNTLTDNFLISTISKQDALTFINTLNANKPKKEETVNS
jgi:preprotein translocase subunit SecD